MRRYWIVTSLPPNPVGTFGCRVLTWGTQKSTRGTGAEHTMALVPCHSLGAFPEWGALLYKSSYPGAWETEAEGLLMNPPQAVTYTRLPGMLPQPSHGLFWPGKVRLVCGVRGRNGSETTEFPWDEIVLGQAVLSSSVVDVFPCSD